jgi:hypothetical protein
MQYVERKLVVDIGGFNFAYEWHDITDKGFTLAMPWKLKVRHGFSSLMPVKIYGSNLLFSGHK